MSERELVTVAFGNYSTLVAAQWVNGTSVYDQHHNTLFCEKNASRVQGGSAGSSSSGVARVPRLLLFDAPHASHFEDVQELEDHLARQAEETGSHTADTEPEAPASLLWGASAAAASLTREEQQLQALARQLENQWWDRGQVQMDSTDDEDDDDEGAVEEESADHRQPPRGRAYHEDGYQYSQLIPENGSGLAVETAASDEEAASAPPNAATDVRDAPPLSTHELHRLKRRLFRARDRTVPWWRYITTGLDRESILALKPLHHVDGAGDIPLMHSAGFGLRHVRPGASAEVDQLGDALRHQMEDGDHVQGLQTFVDGDSLFAGVAHNVLEAFWEDEGTKVPVTLFTTFTALPSALTDPAMAAHVPFVERRQEEVWLNRLLATSCLSASPAALYVPIEMGHWEKFFAAPRSDGAGAGGQTSNLVEWLEDDTATAQYLATVADTALYGLRDGAAKPSTGGAEHGSGPVDARGEEARTETRPARRGRARADLPPPAVGETSGPAYHLAEWQRTVRPTASLRVAALMGALPVRVAGNQQRDLWECLEGMPLLGTSAAPDGGGEGSWGRGFVPLTHAMCSPASSEAGRVMGHAVTLRGPGMLPSRVYPTQEALLRYALPLRTSTYLPLLTRTNYPLSATFPMNLMFPKDDLARLEAQLPVGKQLRDAVVGVDVAAHTLSTFNSAPMLQDIVTHSEKILRHRAHLFVSSYGMEKDDWAEYLEDVKEIHDDYRHEDFIDDDEDADNLDW